MVITELRVYVENMPVVGTPAGGDPWPIEHRSLSKVKEDGNGKLSLTLKVSRLPDLRRRKWAGWPLAWIGVDEADPLGWPYHCPPGPPREEQGHSTHKVCLRVSNPVGLGRRGPAPARRSGRRPGSAGTAPPQAANGPPVEPTVVPRVPLVIQQTKGLPALKPCHQSTPPAARLGSAQPAKPPAAKPTPKPSKPSPKSTT